MYTLVVVIPLALLCAGLLTFANRRRLAGMRRHTRHLVGASLIITPGLLLLLTACAGKGK